MTRGEVAVHEPVRWGRKAWNILVLWARAPRVLHGLGTGALLSMLACSPKTPPTLYYQGVPPPSRPAPTLPPVERGPQLEAARLPVASSGHAMLTGGFVRLRTVDGAVYVNGEYAGPVPPPDAVSLRVSGPLAEVLEPLAYGSGRRVRRIECWMNAELPLGSVKGILFTAASLGYSRASFVVRRSGASNAELQRIDLKVRLPNHPAPDRLFIDVHPTHGVEVGYSADPARPADPDRARLDGSAARSADAVRSFVGAETMKRWNSGDVRVGPSPFGNVAVRAADSATLQLVLAAAEGVRASIVSLDGDCVGDFPALSAALWLDAPDSARAAQRRGSGSLPGEVVGCFLKSRRPAVRDCYRSGLKRDPDLVGELALKILIGSDGRVIESSVARSSLPDATMRQCVLAHFASLRFPALDADSFTLVQRMRFIEGFTVQKVELLP